MKCVFFLARNIGTLFCQLWYSLHNHLYPLYVSENICLLFSLSLFFPLPLLPCSPPFLPSSTLSNVTIRKSQLVFKYQTKDFVRIRNIPSNSFLSTMELLLPSLLTVFYSFFFSLQNYSYQWPAYCYPTEWRHGNPSINFITWGKAPCQGW